MKKVLFALVVSLLVFSTIEAQPRFPVRFGESGRNAAENAAVRKAEQKTDEAINKGIDRATDPEAYKAEEERRNNNNNSSSNQGGNSSTTSNSATGNQQTVASADAAKAAEMAYAKSDFVAGDVIFFDDPMDNEKLGEFPSQWDLLRGNAEVASFNGLKGIFMEASSTMVAPLIGNMKNYLPDVFTVELDFWVNNYNVERTIHQRYFLNFTDDNNNRIMQLNFGGQDDIRWEYITPDGDNRYGDLNFQNEKTNSWNHLSVSFNKRAFKAYINGVRVTNIPNMAAPKSLSVEREHWNDHRAAITNIRIAKGAVPLYDRMMSEGKFITYGITFDVGKSVIKPESMGEINRIVTLMKENADLKFSVEGHTDNTGNAASNQTLSEARSKAIVDKLVGMGISADRLNNAGKGQTSPIADNSTDEGRAKNRRVEFVKL
jgi:outer membrane protein OmpA-like peptidoglycan-associated protein